MTEQSIRRLHQPLDPALQTGELHPVLQQVYANRGVHSVDEVNYHLERLLTPDGLKGIADAVSLLVEALQQQHKILVVGDFDADGATSTAVCLRALKMLGHSNMDYLVPNRFDFGYGLTPELVAVAVQGKPDLIITVDNGIASNAGVAAAQAAGIRVLVTDHHLAADELPSADAIVNPNQPGCDFPAKSTAGVGVIFYVMLALRKALREQGWFNPQRPQPNLGQLLDLVALGTVADVVPLETNNRILVNQGLKRIRSGQACAGIRALLQVAGREPAYVVATDLGFTAGPRLNAAGRLEDMSIGIECLLTDDDSRALQLATELDQLNANRKLLESDMQDQALVIMQQLLQELGEGNLPHAICLFHPEWHQGVIGILASRIREKYNRPVVIFAPADNGEIKGSARSIKGFHIRDAMDVVDKQHPELITKFGGHAMAAGLSMPAENFIAFAEAMNQVAKDWLDEDMLTGVIETDGELMAQDMNLELAEALRLAGPWGQHFHEPRFDGEFEVVEYRIVGEKHLKLRLRMVDADEVLDAIAFNASEERLLAADGYIRAAYRLDVNRYRNQCTAQLVIDYFEPV